MKGLAQEIEIFLQMKNRKWHERELYDYRKNIIRKARDEDFRGERLYELCLEKDNGTIIQRAMLISRYTFIIFDEDKKEVEANFTWPWQKYLEKRKKIEENRQKFAEKQQIIQKNNENDDEIEKII
ncbi:MAG: hypothetical protein J6J24_02495 [Clostridia bacterium]|nr:hypothetical protein [Clostridia bacterium]